MIFIVDMFFYKKLETRYKKQEGEAPAAHHFTADLPVVLSFMVRCGLVAHVRYMKELGKLLKFRGQHTY